MEHLIGKITTGCKIARMTVKQQANFFINKGIPEEFLINGTINIAISPLEFEVINPDFIFKNIEWKKDFKEDFNLVKVKIKFENKIHNAYLYNPKRTKNPKTMVEILSKFINNIDYGKRIELIVPNGKIKFIINKESPLDE